MTALLFGSVIAALCAVIYFAIVQITGIQLALVTIAIGWGVGKAVFLGSKERGGWWYQVLAVSLTYLALGASLTACVIAEAAKDETASAVATATPGSTGTPAPAPDDDPEWTPAEFVLHTLAMLVAAPVLICLDAPVCFLIYGFGLWEAWRQSRARPAPAT